MAEVNSIALRHAARLLGGLNLLKLSQWECDYQIKAGNKLFLVHRAVLAAFSNNYKQTMEIEGVDEIDLPVSEDAAGEFVKFIYSGNAAVTFVNCDEMLLLATNSDSRELMELCSKFLEDNLATTNCLSFRKICKKYELGSTLMKVVEFIEKSFDDVIKTETFLQLEKSEVSKCLHEFTLSSQRIWDAIYLWTNFRHEDRTYHLHELVMDFVKVFPVQLIVGRILQNPLVSAIQSLKYGLLVEVFSDLERFKSSVTKENVFYLDMLCQKFPHHNSDGARQHVVKFMASNLRTLKNSDKMIDISHEDLLKLFMESGTRKGLADTMWNILVKWTNHNIIDRQIFFPELFALINLREFAPEILQRVIRQDVFVKANDSCVDKVIDALVYHCNSTPPPPKKQRRVTDDVTCEKELKEQIFIAVYMRATGKLSGFNIEQKHKLSKSKGVVGKPLLSTKVSSEAFQGAVNIDNSDFVLKGSELKLHSFKADQKNSWKKRRELPERPSSDAKMLLFQKEIYVVQAGIFWIYNIATDVWSRRNVPEITGTHFCVCSTDKHLFILGGELTPLRALQYEPMSKDITSISDMQHPRNDAAAAACEEKLYVLGGTKHREASRSMEYYSYNNPCSKWVLIDARMKFDRWGFAACSHANKIFAVGGIKPASTCDSIEVYNTKDESGKWEELTSTVQFQAPFCAFVITRMEQPHEKPVKAPEKSDKSDNPKITQF